MYRIVKKRVLNPTVTLMEVEASSSSSGWTRRGSASR